MLSNHIKLLCGNLIRIWWYNLPAGARSAYADIEITGGGDFEAFRPAGATYCTIGWNRLYHAKFHPNTALRYVCEQV